MNVSFKQGIFSLGSIGKIKKAGAKASKEILEEKRDDFLKGGTEIETIQRRIKYYKDAKNWHMDNFRKQPLEKRSSCATPVCVKNIRKHIKRLEKELIQLKKAAKIASKEANNLNTQG